MKTTADIQRRLIALGYPLPKYGADGDFGGETQTAINAALSDLEALRGTPVVSGGKIDRAAFYAALKKQGLFGGVLDASQVVGMDAILDGWEKSGLTDLRWLAYMLATAYHETARRMRAVRETLAPTDDQAITILEKAFAAGKLPWVKTPYWRKDADGKSWLGRGLVQLTHRKNYLTMSNILGVDLVGQPSYALNDDIAVEIMIEGMTKGASSKGDFTGKSLEDYFNASLEDWTNARRIINGVESAGVVAGYGQKFYTALKAA
ncbi:MAG TPA: hypothetical protein VL202_12980 [Pararhizobium sp.]|uniref:hypothetical protein n=1 Tax=Pararhizobium sp. TaxID=1977563 RepID=UPI002B560967|nr:hypothetical protein [Pararhizobium sp.]HTO32076.1 hypothetical protein [Pararhizobium sp.]